MNISFETIKQTDRPRAGGSRAAGPSGAIRSAGNSFPPMPAGSLATGAALESLDLADSAPDVLGGLFVLLFFSSVPVLFAIAVAICRAIFQT